MEKIFKEYLFGKHILVSEGEAEEKHPFETLFSLASLFNIRITEGEALVRSDMIAFAAEQLGENVPDPFYKGFPDSVRALSKDQLIFDQLIHYFITYGLGDFSEAGHSLFEEQLERAAFNEKTEIRDFRIVTETEAVQLLRAATDQLLAGTRPVSESQYDMIREFILTYDHKVQTIASKDTATLLLMDTRNLRFAEFLSLSDVIRLVDALNYEEYENENLNQLNLRNQDRKFITELIHKLFSLGHCNVRACFEKKKTWNGLLHHLHFKAKNEEEQAFVDAMRGRKNESVYSAFERAMAEGEIVAALDLLKKEKGSAAVLRNLNYILSRCKTLEDFTYVVKNVDSKNTIVLIQLIIAYSNYERSQAARTFKFTKYNKLKIHQETEEEMRRRKSYITLGQAEMLAEELRSNLRRLLAGRLGKVYIDPEMQRYALPLQESASQSGFGVLARGTRLPIGETKKLRAFTYWEKVNDIDLSCFAIDSKGRQQEFSWRNMADHQSDAVTYSGDETSGFNGGSEYFDIDLELFRKKYPDYRYMIFCDNVFSRVNFDECFCKAGYMLRDIDDTGFIYEPKTVQSSFLVNSKSTFAYLFGLDLTTNEFIWLNMARNSRERVAGDTDMRFLTDYFHVTKVMNVYDFFRMMAAEIVFDPAKAEVVVTNKTVEVPEGVEVIREYDFEKIMALV
jgi:hypothetical protein